MEKDQGTDNIPTSVLKGNFRNGAGPVCSEKRVRVNYAQLWKPPI